MLFENYIRGGNSTVIGDRYGESDINKQILYKDENNLYGLAMSQYYLPTGDFEQVALNQQNLLKILQTPDNSEFGYFIDCDLEYPAEI